MNHKEIAQIISNNGGRLYYVGGCVRDELMNQSPKDIDFCVVGISSNMFKELFKNAIIIGSSFPVFQLEKCEFAFARKETKISEGHTGFITDTQNVTIEEDLLRRDVTVNSIAKDVLTDELIDPFFGKNDIDNRILRATSNHFVEDPLRIYRVAQFATRFGFEIENGTKNLMISMKNELYSLSAERVFTELEKALSAEKPSVFFDILKELNLLDVHFKEILDLVGMAQPVQYHPEGDAYVHSMIVLDKVSEICNDKKVRFAALVHDLGKGQTPKEILPHHYDHDKNGVLPTKALCKRLKMPSAWEKLAVISATEHMHAGMFEKMTTGKQVAFIEKNIKYLKELEIIARVDSNDASLSFATLGNKLMTDINGKSEKLPNNKHAKEILHASRVELLKKLNCK